MKNKLDETYEKYFSTLGFPVRQEQENVIINVLNGNNTLCLMPTGHGKSLCYWVAAKALEGIAVVIFPLTALMDEQASKLRNLGFSVSVLHSGVNSKQQYNELLSLYRGELPDFIFMSPERLATDGFVEYVLKSIKEKIKLFVIDEIHCISQWGTDFRPFYKDIPRFLENVFGDKKPVLLGLTATLNPKDLEEICKDFNVEAENILRSKYLLRYNIKTQVVKVADEDEKDELLWSTIEDHSDEKILIYVDRKSGKRSTETLAQEAIELGYDAAFFHSGLSSAAKADVIAKFKSGELRLIFATSAFGMGIDIPDIRGVIHYLPSESIEQYYQQIGRAGRDKKAAWAKLFYSDKNVDVRRDYFIEPSFPTEAQIHDAYTILTNNSVGKQSVNYFQEEGIQTAFQYILRSGLVEIVTKGVQSLNAFSETEEVPQFAQYWAATKNKNVIVTAVRMNISEEEICENIYHWLASGEITMTSAPAKCLIMKSHAIEIDESNLELMLSDIALKKEYKYSKLNEFIALLDEFSNHTEFQQKIGAYLGIDRFELQKIHETLSGEMVRSKSEVIVANILTEKGIPFIYEPELYSPDGTEMYRPDFAITKDDVTYYWEHLGMTDNEEYMTNWSIKKDWYNKHFPNRLIITEDSSVLSKQAEELALKYFSPH